MSRSSTATFTSRISTTGIYFPLSLPPGSHEVVAESDSGGTLRESFEVPRNKTRYAIIEHWTDDDSAETDDAPVDLLGVPAPSACIRLSGQEALDAAIRSTRHPGAANRPLIGTWNLHHCGM